MGRIRQWWNRLVVAPETAPEDPAAWIAFRLAAMTPLARKRAEALRREAAEYLGSLDKVDDWLTGSIPFLGNRRPIDIMHSDGRANAVETALHNLRHGIYY